MNYPKLNVRKPVPTDINWINLQADDNGFFGIQLNRREFSLWTPMQFKGFFSHFGTIPSVYIDKSDRYVYIRFTQKEEAYSAMICLKRICMVNPALNQYPIYVQIMNTQYTEADLAKTFEPYSPLKIVPHRYLKCVYVVYLFSSWSYDWIIKKFPDGEHPFTISLNDPNVGFIATKQLKMDVTDEPITNLNVTLLQNGQRKVTDTTSVISFDQQNYDESIANKINKYIRRETLEPIYKQCCGETMDKILGGLEPNSRIKILCKESFREGLWGVVVTEDTDVNEIDLNRRFLRGMLNFVKMMGVLEEVKSQGVKCGAVVNGDLHRAYLLDPGEKIVFLVDEGSIVRGETLLKLPECVWSDHPISPLRPFLFMDSGVFPEFKKDEVVEVTLGHCLLPPEDHIFSIC